MKTCAVTVAIWMKSDLVEIVNRVARRFEKLNEIPVRIISNVDLRGEFLSAAQYAKYYAWNFVPPDTERIVYFDCDMIPLRPLPELPIADFAAAPDTEDNFKACATHWPIIQRAGAYFNAGFLVATRRAEKVFNRMLLRQTHAVGATMPWHVDQSMLNVEVQAAVEAGELTFEQLPPSWNNLVLLDVAPVEKPFMLHLSNGGAYRLRIAGYAIKQFEQVELSNRIGRQSAR